MHCRESCQEEVIGLEVVWCIFVTFDRFDVCNVHYCDICQGEFSCMECV